MSEGLVAGQHVGPYRVLFRLGKGGMGEVWAASQGKADLGFSKLVALKVLLDKAKDSNAAVMFFDEAKAASALQHQAIVPTVDLGQDGDIFYLAMEMVRGPSLTALLQRLVINKRKMTPAMVGHIGTNIASALDYGQTRATLEGKPLRLIHRDVSPHNVLLDLNGAVRLTDFGVARTEVQDHKSRVGTVRGKPSYMAPEQVIGGDIDGRTDVFALGIVLYESACLKRLFGRSNPVKSMDAVLKHTPKPLTDMVPDFPVDLWHVIEKALQKEPNQRFQSSAEMVEALVEATRKLEGTTTAPMDLVALISKNFEADSFDIESKVEAALAEAGISLDQPPPDPTVARPVVDVSPVEVAGTRVVWPTAYAPDPLAPEAIEEARTQFRALTPSTSAPMHMHSPSVDLTPLSPSGQSFVAVPPPRKRSVLLPAMALAVAALVAATVAVVVTRAGEQPLEETVAAAPIEPPPPVLTPRVEQNVSVQPKSKPKPKPKPVPAREASPPHRTVHRPAHRKPPPRKEKPAAPEPAAPTFKQVVERVKALKAVDKEKGDHYWNKLLEGGRDPEFLASVDREVRKAIQRATK